MESVTAAVTVGVTVKLVTSEEPWSVSVDAHDVLAHPLAGGQREAVQRPRADAALEHLEVGESFGQEVPVVVVVGDQPIGQLRRCADGSLLLDGDPAHGRILTRASCPQAQS
jgi:hypothetical protein